MPRVNGNSPGRPVAACPCIVSSTTTGTSIPDGTWFGTCGATAALPWIALMSLPAWLTAEEPVDGGPMIGMDPRGRERIALERHQLFEGPAFAHRDRQCFLGAD